MVVPNKVPPHVSSDSATRQYEFHTRATNEILTLLNSAPNGIAGAEADSRRKRYGYNRFTPERSESLFDRIFKQLRSPLALVLVLAFFVTLALQEFVDAGVIAFALFIAVVVGVIQEGKASSAFSKLANSQVKRATVLRAGQKHELDAEQLVPGDVVVLQSGARVPADVRLLSAKQLSINEATLTGEWRAVDKQTEPVAPGAPLADQASMAWMGTFVAEGYGTGVVVATGDATQVGELAGSMRDVEEVDTPLQGEMKELSRWLIMIIGALVLVIFVVGLWQGQTLHDMLLMSIAIAVASIPEGLPAAVTIILAVGMEALLRRGGLVRNLLAAETLGSTTYVLTDKTGTLTEGKMSVTGLLQGDGTFIARHDIENDTTARHTLDVALAAADAYTDKNEAGEAVLRGDPVEQGILRTATTVGINEAEESWRAARCDYMAFTSEKRFAAGLVAWSEGNYLAVNGSPGTLLSAAASAHTGEGVVPMSDDLRTTLRKAIDGQTQAGKRLVAVGYKEVEYDNIPEANKALLQGIIFAGVLVFDDPVRTGVADSIAGVKDAGARVMLITGDNPQTALAIAQAVGIAGTGDTVITGAELAEMTDNELDVALREVTVFARVLPKQKMRIATALQRKGEVVAMTGDGINDAPALRRANIGVAIGSGTEVAKEASDLVLMNDSFAIIYAAIEEGRRVIANLRKIVGYLLSTSLSEVVLIAAALLTASPVPILPAQILWANIIEEGLMSVAFAFEKGERGAMQRRPQDIHAEGLISRDMLWFIIFTIAMLSVLNVTLYFYLQSLNLPLADLRSLMFLAIAMDSLFISFAFRSLTTPVWRIPLTTNLFFVGSFMLSVVLFAIALTIPFMQYLLSYQPQPWNLILLPVIASIATLLLVEMGKYFFFERRR